MLSPIMVVAEEKRFDLSGNVTLSTGEIGGIIGVDVSPNGFHVQPYVRLTHLDSGVFIEGWASNGNGDMKSEVDLCAGVTRKMLDGAIAMQADYCVFWIELENGVRGDVHNNRLFLSSTQKGLAPYVAFQYFHTDDFGPGNGLGFKYGLKYGRYSLEVGGHDGLFGEKATAFSFARFSISSNPIKSLGDTVFTLNLQYGHENPINDNAWTKASTPLFTK